METRSAAFFLFLLLSLLLAVVGNQTTANTKGPVYLRILEDDRGEGTNFAPGPSQDRLIRPVFENDRGTWATVESLSRELSWTIAFAGGKLGEVRSRPILEATSEIDSGTHMILTAPAGVPAIGKPSDDFADFGGPGKMRRPLVVVSQANFQDPDSWKRVMASGMLTTLVHRYFRQEFPHIYDCDEEKPRNADVAVPDSDIQLRTTYESNKNSFLVEVQLKHRNCYVDDANDPWANQWYFVSAGRAIHRIGAFMRLLDAGDYDADGKSEVLFFLTQPEDTDGYVLFYDEFRKKVSLTWSYH